MTRSSFDLVKGPIGEFKMRVRQEAECLLTRDPSGFEYCDVAKRLGGEFLGHGRGERRLRNCLDRLVKENVLKKIARGQFTKGAAFGAMKRPVAGLIERIDSAFHNAGGIMSMAELLPAVHVSDDDGARLVRRCLQQSRRYYTGLDIDGYDRHWLLSDVYRKAIPLAGRWIALDLRLAGHRFFSGNLESEAFRDALADCRARIARALRDARRVAKLNGKTFADGPVGKAFEDACRGATKVFVPGPFSNCSAHRMSVAELWEETAGCGEVGVATSFLCDAVEGDDPQWHYIVQALDVHFWEALGEATSFDPVFLSRGAILAAEHPSRRGNRTK